MIAYFANVAVARAALAVLERALPDLCAGEFFSMPYANNPTGVATSLLVEDQRAVRLFLDGYNLGAGLQQGPSGILPEGRMIVPIDKRSST